MRLAVAALCAALLTGCGVEADFSGDLKAGSLQAEKYQREIASIDQLLFRESPLGADGVRSLQSVLETLAGRVSEVDPKSRFLKLESLELRLLAERAGRLPADGTGAALQNDWMRIRNNLFDDRAWFVRSAADLEYAARTVPRSPGTLVGRWQVTSVQANGKFRDDPEITRSIWDFQPPRLIVKDGTGRETTYSCDIQNDYIGVSGERGDGWIRYELVLNELRLAFFDGLKGKPEGFEPPPGQRDPLLIVIRLAPVR